MPNIAITTYCNLHCPYCFADTMINTEDIKNISLEQFEFTLKWLERTPKNQSAIMLGLIGGEPTLHPQFKEILKLSDQFLTKNKGHGILFTNGVYLEQYLPLLPADMDILLNVNTPTAMSKEQWDKLNKTLQKLYLYGWLGTPKTTIGCNICMEIDDYSFIWNIVDKYNIKHVRTSVTAPTKEKYKKDKDAYYMTMIPKFMEFVKEADKRGISLGRDCNFIPYCYYENPNDLKLVQKVLEIPFGRELQPHCGPVIDITPDFMASACFGAYELVNCSKFENYEQLNYYLFNKCIMPKFMKNNLGKCKDCEKHELLQCQGGCLAFSSYTKGD